MWLIECNEDQLHLPVTGFCHRPTKCADYLLYLLLSTLCTPNAIQVHLYHTQCNSNLKYKLSDSHQCKALKHVLHLKYNWSPTNEMRLLHSHCKLHLCFSRPRNTILSRQNMESNYFVQYICVLSEAEVVK